ncbi:MAG: hypothetical protein WCX65_11330 [bacterium]
MPLQDPNSDTNGSRNIVSDATHAAAFYFFDGTYLNFRMRLDQDPTGQGGQGLLKQFGWGALIDTNRADPDYEFLVMLDGISQTETISLWQNTVQGDAGSPADQPEALIVSNPVSTNYQISMADSSINGDQDYFLDWRISYAWITQAAGIGINDPIRLFFGSSSSANTLSENGGDLVGTSDLTTSWSDYFLPNLAIPSDGSVMFVANLAGTGDVTQAGSGEVLYIKVSDNDRNGLSTTIDTTFVTITTQNGDSVVITLTETGVNTGVFTGSILPVTGVVVSGDGVLQVTPGENVTVKYNDIITANLSPNVLRTDVLQILPPVITIAKSVDAAFVLAGATSTYTITITNSGSGDGMLTTIKDSLPNTFSYKPNTTTGLTTSNPTISGQNLTWAGNWVVPRKTGGVNGSVTLSFKAKAGSVIGTYNNTVIANGNNISVVSTGPTAPVTVTSPILSLTKQGDSNVAPGSVITFTIIYRNTGGAAAKNVNITDTVPAKTTFVPGSLRMGNAASTYATATPKTDAADGDGAEISGANIYFKISDIGPDDSVAGSGTDEGKVYFQVQIN